MVAYSASPPPGPCPGALPLGNQSDKPTLEERREGDQQILSLYLNRGYAPEAGRGRAAAFEPGSMFFSAGRIKYRERVKPCL